MRVSGAPFAARSCRELRHTVNPKERSIPDNRNLAHSDLTFLRVFEVAGQSPGSSSQLRQYIALATGNSLPLVAELSRQSPEHGQRCCELAYGPDTVEFRLPKSRCSRILQAAFCMCKRAFYDARLPAGSRPSPCVFRSRPAHALGTRSGGAGRSCPCSRGPVPKPRHGPVCRSAMAGKTVCRSYF